MAANTENCFFKQRIVTTGPTPVPDFVLSAMTNSVFYHRGPAFAEIMKEVRELLPPIFGTQNEVLVFNGTGTLAMEGAIANFLAPGDEVINVNAGKFGERWGQQAKVYGCQVHEIKVEHGSAVAVSDVEALLQKHPHVRGILVHASETSTGVRHDVKAIAALAQKQKDCLCIVDGVTSVGVFHVPMDAWGIDVLVGGSQKGMMLPPGLSFGTASQKAWARSESLKNVRYYMDWRKERKAALENTGAFTSAVTLVGGLREVLRYFHKEGLETIFKRNWKMCFATRQAAKAMGFDLLVKNDSQVSAACTSILAEGSFTGEIRKKYGMTVSGGQDALKGKIVRVGHMGWIDAWDVANQIWSVGVVGQQLGKNVNPELGLKTFFDVVNSNVDFTPADLKGTL
jgi:aspartate aminotransferase-like enzyme